MEKRNWLRVLGDNLIGYDDGYNTPGEKLARTANALGTAIFTQNPVNTLMSAGSAVKGDLDNLMFEGGAMQRPEAVMGYAAGVAAPGAASGRMANVLSSGGAKPSIQDLMAEARGRIAQRNATADVLSGDARPVKMASSGGRNALVSPSPDKPGQWRITTFGDDGKPSGHIDAADKRSAISRALEDGYTPPEPNAPSLTPAQAQAQEVIDMLKSGRGADVTDDMLAAADDMYLYNNYDLPMDEAARMARAQEMGFDTETPLYHGSVRDFSQFIPSERGKVGPGVYMTPDQKKAATFSGYDRGPTERIEQMMNADNQRTSQVYPLTATNRPATMEARQNARAGASAYDDRIEAYRKSFDEAGFDGVSVDDERTILNPANIRSQFARFDPRLKNLANLSAGGAGAAYLAESASNEERGAFIDAYLAGKM